MGTSGFTVTWGERLVSASIAADVAAVGVVSGAADAGASDVLLSGGSKPYRSAEISSTNSFFFFNLPERPQSWMPVFGRVLATNHFALVRCLQVPPVTTMSAFSLVIVCKK